MERRSALDLRGVHDIRTSNRRSGRKTDESTALLDLYVAQKELGRLEREEAHLCQRLERIRLQIGELRSFIGSGLQETAAESVRRAIPEAAQAHAQVEPHEDWTPDTQEIRPLRKVSIKY